MAIVTMKRLRLIGLSSQRDAMFQTLLRLGCVELTDQTEKLSDPELNGLLRKNDSDLPENEQMLSCISDAIAILDQYVPEKSSFLSPRELISENALFDSVLLQKGLKEAEEVARFAAALREADAKINKLQAQKQSLIPWLPMDLPLSTGSTNNVSIAFGTLPVGTELAKLRTDLSDQADAWELFHSSSDTEFHYVTLFCHRSQEDTCMDILRRYGFSTVSFKDFTAPAQQETLRLNEQIKMLAAEAAMLKEQLMTAGAYRNDLKLCSDSLQQSIAKETHKELLIQSESTFLLEGWVPASEEKALTSALKAYTCACELSAPAPEDYPQVPVKLKNGPLSRCMNVVTEMYSLPAYDGIDPNPLMAPFFIFFFGMMMADMAYGILMVAAALIVLKKSRPREGTRNFMELVLLCGIATFIFGALTGGFFGDFIPQLLRIIDPQSTFQMPALFTPLDDTVAILLGSLVLGVIQVITGMVVSVVKKIKDGNFWDAFWDEITWWIILAGAALSILGITPIPVIIGGLMLVYGSGRNAKGFGKVTALIGAVYNGVTGYFSDILSYLRLMALMLSGSVIAQVFNTLGSVFGNVIIFILISMIGNALNLALNLLGCYVHDLRLQCLEYFNRFYKDGGRAYAPLSIQTKYHDIIKEEN